MGCAAICHTLFPILGGMVAQAYRVRNPKASPLWQCLSQHFDTFIEVYETRYQPRHGFLRPIIPEVVNKFLDCGDMEQGWTLRYASLPTLHFVSVGRSHFGLGSPESAAITVSMNSSCRFHASRRKSNSLASC